MDEAGIQTQANIYRASSHEATPSATRRPRRPFQHVGRGSALAKESGGGGPASASHRVQVSPLVLGAVAGVAEGLLAAGVLAQVRLLSRVAPQVDLQVLQAGERFVTALELRGKRERRLSRHIYVHPHAHIYIYTRESISAKPAHACMPL